MKKKKKILTWVVALTLILSLAGCGNKNQTEDTQNTQKAVKEETIENKKTEMPTSDRSGNKITIPETVDSIISLAPSITETVIALGCGDKLTAVDTNSVGREGVSEELPAFDLMNPDVEKLAELHPDLILVSGISLVDGKDPFKPLTDMGIGIVCIPTSESIQGIKEDLGFLGQILKKEEKSDALILEMESEIEKIAAIGKTITDKKSVYFEIAAAPYMYSCGSGVYLNEMMDLIGAKNVFAQEKGWMSVENEMAVNANPDVILTNVNYVENPCDEILGRKGWEEITAIKNGEVYYIDNMSSSLPNQNIVKALKEMAVAVYPELYK
ncbi:MAG: ABC transporter substrate-binding protein [Acetivibrio sp.]